ncbi:hypothetical protein UMZ34_06215 [Halopseudomonas pachastrellae]|nr:hypothetical protein UMZ34_06215 [Halopseudomonas pachastrellae]
MKNIIEAAHIAGKTDAFTFRLDDDTGRPENVPDRSQMKAYITELDHLVKVHD